MEFGTHNIDNSPSPKPCSKCPHHVNLAIAALSPHPTTLSSLGEFFSTVGNTNGAQRARALCAMLSAAATVGGCHTWQQPPLAIPIEAAASCGRAIT
mmetsp:Transcript_48284/g.108779  ORF Transcript_48284/g.108779 Transcript_48284/m.108779 type:complete len:97 (+) Transcript_48284:218-508(+)